MHCHYTTAGDLWYNTYDDSVSTNGTTTGYNYLHGAYTEGTIVGATLYGNILNIHGDVTGTYQGTTKVNAAQFDAFGRVSSSSGTFRNPYGYSGEYTDATGLQYLRARYYNPELGRFTQQDTWRDQGNPYVYCSNNPVVYTDPSGHCKRYGIPDVKKTIWMISDLESEAIPGCTYKKKDLYCGNAPFYEVEMNWWSDLCAEWPLHYNMTHDENGNFIGEKNFYYKLHEDIVNFDIDNTDVEKVFASHYFSAYKGAFVLRHKSDFLTSGAFAQTIFLNHNNKSNDNDDYDNDKLSPAKKARLLNHEYGHIQQEREFGGVTYLLSVAVPSVIYNLASRNNDLSRYYYSMPWEYDADQRGDVKRSYNIVGSEDFTNLYILCWRIMTWVGSDVFT